MFRSTSNESTLVYNVIISDSEKTGCSMSNVASTCTNLFKSGGKRKYIPSVSSSLIVGALLGFLQAILLTFGAKFLLNIMGVKSVSIFSRFIKILFNRRVYREYQFSVFYVCMFLLLWTYKWSIVSSS